jgi:methionine biosynthesis protein MetW
MGRVLRSDLALVANWIAPGSAVLDLGCGDGALLAYLQEEKDCRCVGVELDSANCLMSIENGVEVIQQNLEDGLSMFSDHSFDCVLQLQSLQMVQHTEAMLREIGRIGQEGIVTFPNFGHWTHRLSILNGRMPVSKSLPYQWYNSPNLRFSTMVDIIALARASGFRIVDCVALHEGHEVRLMPNLLGSLAMLRLARDPAQNAFA